MLEFHPNTAHALTCVCEQKNYLRMKKGETSAEAPVADKQDQERGKKSRGEETGDRRAPISPKNEEAAASEAVSAEDMARKRRVKLEEMKQRKFEQERANREHMQFLEDEERRDEEERLQKIQDEKDRLERRRKEAEAREQVNL